MLGSIQYRAYTALGLEDVPNAFRKKDRYYHIERSTNG